MSNENAPETDVRESDPNADSADGLAGGMGVSSERVGPVRGQTEPGTYAAAATHPDVELDTGLPEQSPDGPEVQPDAPVHKKGAGRLHGYPPRRNHG
ncbi:MAG: hypothetical protein JWO46_2257 [Nocardioidaceae bacterium]|nr:hypothetical protein [Nocardioidaceae bacterium]